METACSDDEIERYRHLCRAVEQLLSDDNLNCDNDLQSHVVSAEDGWIDVASVLLLHPTIKKLEERHGAPIHALTLCEHLALFSEALQVRGGQVRRAQKFITREEDEKHMQLLEETKVFFPLMSPDEVAQIMVPATASDAELCKVFAQHGCALVTDVLTAEECLHFEELWKQDLLDIFDPEIRPSEFAAQKGSEVEKDGPRAWPSIWNGPLGSKGCASQRNLPHGRFSWSSRLHPLVRGTFAKLFGVESDQLAVGTDVVFWKSSDHEPASENKQWLHVDQNHRSGLTHQCAQGVLYVWPSTDENASTTALWPESHLDVYDRLMKDTLAIKKGKKLHASQSVRINHLHSWCERESLAAQAIAGTRRVPCPAGSLLLWDSRLIHQGWASGPRLAQPICWEPRARRDERARWRKLYCCASGVPTTHSSSEGRVHAMAHPGRPAPLGPTTVKPAIKVTVPHCVLPNKKQLWSDLQDMLWSGKGDPSKNASRLTALEAASIEGLLKPEVLDAL